MIQGIYYIKHINSERKYVGSSNNVEKRLTQHKRHLINNSHHNIQLQRAVNKYGIDQFEFYLFIETQSYSKKELLNYEQTFIDANINGYNMAPANGGDILSNHPYKDAIRKQIKHTHAVTISKLTLEERKLKFGKSGSDNHNWKDGGITKKICTYCNLNKIAVNSNACGDCRIRSGRGNSFYGKHHSDETKKKLSDANSGDNSWIKDIAPAKLSYTKRYQIIYPSGEIKEVAGLKIIANEFNVSIENVHATIQRIKLGNIPKRGAFANTIIKLIN